MRATLTTILLILRRVVVGIGRFVRAVARKAYEDDILFLASGLAFNGILTMIPIMLLASAVFGTVLNSSAGGVQQLTGVLDAIFPPQPFAQSIRNSILAVMQGIVEHRASLGLFGVAVLIWTATSLFDALRSALHRIYELRRTRPFFVSLLHDVGFVILAVVLFLASNMAIWVFSVARHLIGNVPALQSFTFPELSKVVPTILVVLLTTVMFYIIYRFLTDVKPPRSAAIISTITTTTLWVISGKAFAVYLQDFSAIGKIYGPYAFLLVLLFWIYYSSIIFVIGGIVGQVYWERWKARHARGGAAHLLPVPSGSLKVPPR